MKIGQEPTITIIIPVRNIVRTIDKMVEHLEELDYPHDKMEILIADGGSSDGTVAHIRNLSQKYSHIKLIEVPNCKSPGQARNAALKVASGEYILFTDGDCAPAKDWIRKIIEPFFKDARIGGVGGEILTLRTEENNLTETYCEQIRFLSPTGRCGLYESGYMPTLKENLPHEVNGGDNSPFYATANFAVSRQAAQKIGNEFWHEPTGEDVDFNLRILNAGYKLYYAKEALVKHIHRVDLKSFCKQWYGYGFGHPLLLAKHAAPKFEIVWQIGRGLSTTLPAKKPGIIHVGKFHLMHLFSLLLILSLLLGFVFDASFASWLFGLLFVLLAGLYFWPCLKLKPAGAFFTFCKIRYLTNYSFIKGAWDGIKKFGAFCIEPSW